MLHLGDITKIDGHTAPAVDVIVGGSPCQDLSVAGKRAGLAGERSGLFMEQIRVIKEMREADAKSRRTNEPVRPRYMVWENVPGAFSSNDGKDFSAVLEETIRVIEPEAPPVYVPQKGWPSAGCIMGDHWSIAWRVLDAQFWGVPQRRRRIALVADFGGHSAPEVLFVREGMHGYSEQGQQAGKTITADVRAGSNRAVAYGIGGFHSGAWLSDNPNSGVYEADTSRTLDSINCGYPGCNQGGMAVVQPLCIEMTSTKNTIVKDGIVPTLTARMGTGGNQVNAILDSVGFEMQAFGKYKNTGIASTLKMRDFKDATDLVVTVEQKTNAAELILDDQGGQQINIRFDGKVPTLRAETHGNLPCVVDVVHGVDCRNGTEYPDLNGTIQSKPGGGFSLNCNQVVRVKNIVRRLTPVECERLQGYPDGWTDIGEWIDSKGKKHKTADSHRYKALGNSIAIPPWKWVLKRLCACYERDATMASLFDGIGGFPYIWEQLNGKGSCLWASEIEEFPMAVTRVRFGSNE